MHIHILPSVVEPLRSEVESHVKVAGCEIAQTPNTASFVIGYGIKAADWPPGIPAEKKMILFKDPEDKRGLAMPMGAQFCVAGEGKWRVGLDFPQQNLGEFLSDKTGTPPKA
ncbi:MAG: hypothetical protein K9M11_00925 [Candidatus Pacebacteria bacterium]|nr:hypothetical protein [Candidatus Paceibacterota bacterium]